MCRSGDQSFMQVFCIACTATVQNGRCVLHHCELAHAVSIAVSVALSSSVR